MALLGAASRYTSQIGSDAQRTISSTRGCPRAVFLCATVFPKVRRSTVPTCVASEPSLTLKVRAQGYLILTIPVPLCRDEVRTSRPHAGTACGSGRPRPWGSCRAWRCGARVCNVPATGTTDRCACTRVHGLRHNVLTLMPRPAVSATALEELRHPIAKAIMVFPEVVTLAISGP